MRTLVRHLLSSAAAACLLCLLTFLGTAAAAVGLAGTTLPTAFPKRPVLLDMTRPSLGKLRLGQPAATYMRAWGPPNDVQVIPGGPVMLWYSAAGLRAAVGFPDASEQSADSIYYAADLRTTRGDRTGTTIASFLRHWPNAQPANTDWAHTFHVTNVWVYFTAKKRLAAIELGQRHASGFFVHGLRPPNCSATTPCPPPPPSGG